MLPGLCAAGLMGAADVGPAIASFSQSSLGTGGNIAPATVANMSDGLFEPFAGTNNDFPAFVRATLGSPAYVDAIVLGPTTASGDWGSQYLDDCVLEISSDNGASWSYVRTLSGYVTASNATTGTLKTEPIGAICTDIRIRRGSGYIGVSEFKIAP